MGSVWDFIGPVWSWLWAIYRWHMKHRLPDFPLQNENTKFRKVFSGLFVFDIFKYK